MESRNSPDTGKVRVLYMGAPISGRGIYSYLSTDPFIQITPVPAHITLYKWDDMRKIIRRYMPRNYQEFVEEYDLISLIGANPLVFTSQTHEWMQDAVIEGGLGNLIVGWGTWHFSDWITFTPLREVFPIEVTQFGEIYRWSEIRIADPESPLMSSLPFDTRSEPKWLDRFTPMTAKIGAHVDAELVTQNGITNPFVVWWDLGRGRSLASSILAGSSWWGYSFYDWEFLPDWYVNLHLYAAGQELPRDPYLVHDIRITLDNFNIVRGNLISTIEFIEKFGAPTDPVERILYETNIQLKEVESAYLDLRHEESLVLAKELVSELNRGIELALEIKDGALRWTYLIEWLVTMGTGMMVGFVLWTLMVRKCLYREIRATRFGKTML